MALTAAGERLLLDAREVLRAMDHFTATAGELAAQPPAVAVGYCHGSERAVMAAIGALRAARPGTEVRADGLTSLRILDGVRAGTLGAGVVRGPVEGSERIATLSHVRVAVDHVAVPPGHRLAAGDVVHAGDLDGEAVLVVDRADAPTAHDEIAAYCAAVGARPRWITHAAVQVERVLDQVAVGAGIGWLNAWQAEAAARRPDVCVLPLRPVALFDEFQIVSSAADPSPTAAAFVQAVVDTCSAMSRS